MAKRWLGLLFVVVLGIGIGSSAYAWSLKPPKTIGTIVFSVDSGAEDSDQCAAELIVLANDRSDPKEAVRNEDGSAVSVVGRVAGDHPKKELLCQMLVTAKVGGLKAKVTMIDDTIERISVESFQPAKIVPFQPNKMSLTR